MNMLIDIAQSMGYTDELLPRCSKDNTFIDSLFTFK